VAVPASCVHARGIDPRGDLDSDRRHRGCWCRSGFRILESGPEIGRCSGGGVGCGLWCRRGWRDGEQAALWSTKCKGVGLMAPTATYTRRRPELDPLHRILSEHLLTFLDRSEHEGAGLPEYVKKEMWGYLDCGLLCKGAIRVHCPDCDHGMVVALSCKGRGICPSCGGRRMNDTAAHLVDRVIPDDVPVRQWVLSLPHRYRFLIAKDVKLLQRVVGIFVRVVFALLCSMAKAAGVADGKPGAVCALQKFGDGLIANTHLHGLFLQGVYHRPVADQPPVFVPLPSPTQEQVAQVANKVKKKVERLLRKQGRVGAQGEQAEAEQEQSYWDRLCAASIQGRIATGPKAGWRVRRVGGQPVLLPPAERYLCADADGFNVHAHTSVGAGHKQERERLCRYILRPALCGQRLSILPSGDVIFHLKRTWSDGTKFLVFTPLELIEKLAVLVPPPGRHLVTYHGIWGSASLWRKEVVPGGQAQGQAPDEKGPGSEADEASGAKPELGGMAPRRTPWAQLMARTFGLDVLCCPKCGGRMKIKAVILDPIEIARLCDHLGEPHQGPPVAPSRYQVQTEWDWGQAAAAPNRGGERARGRDVSEREGVDPPAPTPWVDPP
jgi:hypothetical protein